jgi:ferredoxin-NADP reductase
MWELATEHVGVVLPVAVAVGLVVAARRTATPGLRQPGWRLALQLNGYLGLGLVLPYLLGTGSLLPTAISRYWWTLWAVAAGSVLLWRVALPLWQVLRHDLRVVAVVPEVDHAVSIHLTGRRLDRLAIEPGQRLSWWFLSGAGWLRGQPYSLSMSPLGRTLRITAELSTEAEAKAYALRPGTRALFGFPSGSLSAGSRSRRRVALIGAGAGVIPLRALAEGLAYEPGEAVLLHRYLDRPLFGSEFEQLRQRGLELVPLPGHPRHPDSWLGDASWPGGTRPVTDAAALLAWVPDIAERDVYVSGPAAWVDSVRRALEAAGTPHAQVQIDSPPPALG